MPSQAYVLGQPVDDELLSMMKERLKTLESELAIIRQEVKKKGIHFDMNLATKLTNKIGSIDILEEMIRQTENALNAAKNEEMK